MMRSDMVAMMRAFGHFVQLLLAVSIVGHEASH
jgi:hypothetical protein